MLVTPNQSTFTIPDLPNHRSFISPKKPNKFKNILYTKTQNNSINFAVPDLGKIRGMSVSSQVIQSQSKTPQKTTQKPNIPTQKVKIFRKKNLNKSAFATTDANSPSTITINKNSSIYNYYKQQNKSKSHNNSKDNNEAKVFLHQASLDQNSWNNKTMCDMDLQYYEQIKGSPEAQDKTNKESKVGRGIVVPRMFKNYWVWVFGFFIYLSRCVRTF